MLIPSRELTPADIESEGVPSCAITTVEGRTVVDIADTSHLRPAP